jgi:hypothetical protein
MFERSIQSVLKRFKEEGLGRMLEGIRRIRVVHEESYHDIRTHQIGLNPADCRKPYAAFHTRPYLLIHEIAHHFAEVILDREDRKGVASLFGDYDAPYRRVPTPRAAGRDHVSRYAMRHPAEDFAETFAVCVWRVWDPGGVERLMRGKSPLCRRKLKAMELLLRRQKARGA